MFDGGFRFVVIVCGLVGTGGWMVFGCWVVGVVGGGYFIIVSIDWIVSEDGVNEGFCVVWCSNIRFGRVFEWIWSVGIGIGFFRDFNAFLERWGVISIIVVFFIVRSGNILKVIRCVDIKDIRYRRATSFKGWVSIGFLFYEV